MSEHAEKPERLFEGKHLRVLRRGKWEYVERPSGDGVVAILAVTDAHELVLVEQIRIPVGRRVIELPAGLAGDLAGQETEDLVDAARRELREETGFEAASMEPLMAGPSSAGLCTEIISFFRAHGLRKVADGLGDGSEEITLHLVPLAGLREWLRAREAEGCLVDYKVFAALYWAEG